MQAADCTAALAQLCNHCCRRCQYRCTNLLKTRTYLVDKSLYPALVSLARLSSNLGTAVPLEESTPSAAVVAQLRKCRCAIGRLHPVCTNFCASCRKKWPHEACTEPCASAMQAADCAKAAAQLCSYPCCRCHGCRERRGNVSVLLIQFNTACPHTSNPFFTHQ